MGEALNRATIARPEDEALPLDRRRIEVVGDLASDTREREVRPKVKGRKE